MSDHSKELKTYTGDTFQHILNYRPAYQMAVTFCNEKLRENQKDCHLL